MRSLAALVAALALALPVFACSGSDSTVDDPAADDNVDQGDEQDITAARNQLKGSWTISKDSEELTSVRAYEFRPNGEFFRDSFRVLNGVLINGAPRPVARDSGRYTVNTRTHMITLHVSSPFKSDEKLAYEYTAGRVLNGVFLPGHAPDGNSHLTLTQQPAPMSHVAFPALKFDHADSYCTSTQDCKDEAKDGTWFEGAGAPAVSCDATNRICLAAVN